MASRFTRALASLTRWARKNFWAVVTIVTVAVVSGFAVKAFKKPGQMTVLEANVMDMSAMQPPRGAVPVGAAPVKERRIEGSVTYTGSVRAFEDEDVYPRIQGLIVEMPVYPGDRVRKGQLLALLDPRLSEYASRQQEAGYLADAAAHQAYIAKAEFRRTEHELKAAEAAENAAQQELAQARARLAYWVPEIRRQERLLKQEVVSQEEYDRELADYRTAAAKVEQTEAQVKEAQNKRLAAQAAFDAAVHHVSHQFLDSRSARAAEQTAAIINSYRRIVARDDGVVTKREISPGVVVNPSMLILRVAHIRKARIQAEVSSADLGKIEVGAPVYIEGLGGHREKVEATITSIFPAADPEARTSIVEALVDNVLPSPARAGAVNGAQSSRVDSATQYRFLPGQYVVMRIVTGRKSALTIPTSAVIWREGKAHAWKLAGAAGRDPERYQCPMHPEVVSDHPGTCPKCGMELQPMERSGSQVAQLVPIRIGLSNPDNTEVIDGLTEGDQVIYAGYLDLEPGTPVVAVDWSAAGPVRLPSAADVTGDRLAESNAWSLEQMVDHLMVRVDMRPVPPGSRNNTLVVSLQQHGGAPVSGARVTAVTSMPTMDMAGPELSASAGGPGVYELKSNFSSGLWRAELKIQMPDGRRVERSVNIEVP